MKLMLIVGLYAVCVALIRGVVMKVFGGKHPSQKLTSVITLMAIFWPIWPEIAVVAVFAFVILRFIAFCNNNQSQPQA